MATVSFSSSRPELKGMTRVGHEALLALGQTFPNGVLTSAVTKRTPSAKRDARVRMALEELAKRQLAVFSQWGWCLTPKGVAIYREITEQEKEDDAVPA